MAAGWKLLCQPAMEKVVDVEALAEDAAVVTLLLLALFVIVAVTALAVVNIPLAAVVISATVTDAASKMLSLIVLANTPYTSLLWLAA